MELIKIQKSPGGREVVSAKDLYQFLEIGERFGEWMERMLGYGFTQGVDYQALTVFRPHSNAPGGTKTTDFALTIDTAKEISMIQRTAKGKEARQYFIECEKKLVAMPTLPDFNNPAEAARAWADQFEQRLIAEKEKEVVQLQLEEAKPKVEFFDAVTDSKDAVDMGTAAKVLDLGYGRTTLFEKLRDLKVLMGNNQPYQKYIDGGWFRVIESKWEDAKSGDTHINFKTVLYQKGLDGIRKLLSTENF